MIVFIGIAVLFVFVMVAVVPVVLGFLAGRTGTAVGGCEAAKVDWTEAMRHFFVTEMMDFPQHFWVVIPSN